MPSINEDPIVVAVSKNPTHSFSKVGSDSITLIAGLGVEGDAHSGETVKHRSRVRIDPMQPNLRQVHLIHEELFDSLKELGFRLAPGLIGENITTRGIDLLALPRGTLLQIGPQALIEITGLRNPCKQLDDFQEGLVDAVLERARSGEPIRKAGIMAIVIEGGAIQAGDTIRVTLPDGPHEALERV